ncbi:hypothetical protein ACJWDR_18975 [Streptomyces tauricus]|uniref:hypothetical protein n=1 Tax=Streptomyces tauricus TaxID=68274 RepID=UPI00387F15A3
MTMLRRAVTVFATDDPSLKVESAVTACRIAAGEIPKEDEIGSGRGQCGESKC